jgi:putative sigma-54 modulation protein
MVDKSKFEMEGYTIYITGRNLQVTEAIKNHTMEKIAKVERVNEHITDVHVTLELQRLEHSCMINMKFNHVKITAHALASDIYVAIDEAVEKVRRQIVRWKDKIHDLNKKKISLSQLQVSILERPDPIQEYNQQMEAELSSKRNGISAIGNIIGTEEIPLKTLTSSEAVVKMELSGDPFLVFRGEEDKSLKVIYRRDDGNYGIIKPE